MIKDYYYYNKFNNTEKTAYDMIMRGLTTFKPTISIPKNIISIKQLKAIFLSISLDHPELYYVNFTQYRLVSNLLYNQLLIYYLNTNTEVSVINDNLEEEITEILKNITGKTLWEKEKQLHDYLIKNVEYDYEALKGSIELVTYDSNIVSIIMRKKGVCKGISLAVKYLLNHLDIPCITVIGKSLVSNINHCWNIVLIDNVYSHLDITWDITRTTPNFSCYDYFNIPDQDIKKDHSYLIDVPRCTLYKTNYYMVSKLIVYTKNDIDIIIKRSIANKQKTLTFRFIDKHIESFKDICEYCSKQILSLFPSSSVYYTTNDYQLTAYIRW